MNFQNKGYIYIMINACLPKNMLKIGYTKREPEIRAVELSQSTGLPSEYIVAYEKLVSDCELAEKLIHEKLKKFRLTSYRNDRNREFFSIKLKNAIKILDSISNEVSYQNNGTNKTTNISLEDYLKKTGQTGSSKKRSSKKYKDMFIAFEDLSTEDKLKYAEEIDVYKKIVGFSGFPKKFREPVIRAQAEKIYKDGLKENIPGLAVQKMSRAAHLGHAKAIKWLRKKGHLISYWDFDNSIHIY